MDEQVSHDQQAQPEQFEQAPAAAPRRGRPAWLLPFVAGALVGAGVFGAVWGITGAVSGAQTFTMRGTLNLLGVASCSTIGTGYGDIAEGASVTVYDAAGKVAATGALSGAQPGGTSCTYTLTVQDVPDGQQFYQVEVTHRGKVSVTNADAKAGRLSLTLGG